MSVIAAIKKNGCIYMVCDTLCSSGDRQYTQIGEENRKIYQLQNGMIIGNSGRAFFAHMTESDTEIFTVPDDGELTKEYVVTTIIPKLIKCYKDNNLLEKSENNSTVAPNHYILVYKDKMFTINARFRVEKNEHYTCIGSGTGEALAGLIALDAEDITDRDEINKRLIRIVKISASHKKSVGGPFYLFDSQKQEFELVE